MWQLDSVVPVGYHATNTISQYLTGSYHPDPDPTSPCPILIMPNAGTMLMIAKITNCVCFDLTRPEIDPKVSFMESLAPGQVKPMTYKIWYLPFPMALNINRI